MIHCTYFKKGKLTPSLACFQARRHWFCFHLRKNEDWGEFQDKHFFSQVELSKLLLKAFGLQMGPISYPFLGDQ